MRIPVRGISMAALLFAIIIAAPSIGQVSGQPLPGQRPGQPFPPRDVNNVGTTAIKDPITVQQEANLARDAANERQKRIVDDTARLLQLATELKTDVDKSSKNELSLDVVRKADEIERLAHEVKARMKG